MGLLDKGNKYATRTPTAYSPSDLTRSIASQLCAELKRIYRSGSHELHEKLIGLQKKGLLPQGSRVVIRSDISAIENFLHLNKTSKNSRRLASLTSSQQPFVSFSERELISIFWKKDGLRARLRQLARADLPNTPDPALWVLQGWIGRKEPGYIIKRFLSDVAKEGLTSSQRSKGGYKTAVRLMSLEWIKQHVERMQQATFDPKDYTEKGYILRGSIRTDGFRIQLLAFKLKELQSVRYRRLSIDKLPPRITSTSGGTDYYLTEIRNIVKSKQDVQDLWGCPAEQIKILGIDLGKV
ncbi:hypothetical protein EDD11_000408, partial [Mortierella claussenii]